MHTNVCMGTKNIIIYYILLARMEGLRSNIPQTLLDTGNKVLVVVQDTWQTRDLAQCTGWRHNLTCDVKFHAQ